MSQPADLQAKKTSPQRATSNPPQQAKRKAPSSTGPARRQRKKGPCPSDSMPTTTGSPEVLSPPGGDTPDHSQPTDEELDTWKCIWDLAAKPLVTDRHLPREYVGLWQQVCSQVLREQAAPNDMSPCVSDLFFVLPKLILCRPPGAESRKDRLLSTTHGLGWNSLLPKMVFLRTQPKGFIRRRPRDSSARPGDSLGHLPHCTSARPNGMLLRKNFFRMKALKAPLSERIVTQLVGILRRSTSRMPSVALRRAVLLILVAGPLNSPRAPSATPRSDLKFSNGCMAWPSALIPSSGGKA